MIFLTVGTLFPFDRLVRSVDHFLGQGVVDEEIFAQIGPGGHQPRRMKYVHTLEKESFDTYLRSATSLMGHAGIGTIMMALNHSKPLLVIPRRKHLKEHVNDHQVATARKFEQLGHILVAYEAEEIPEKIEQLRTFVPRKRQAQPQAVAERITMFLNDLATSRK
jgi:UDP-N-acetylglucosamine transferase subunit ALG13